MKLEQTDRHRRTDELLESVAGIFAAVSAVIYAMIGVAYAVPPALTKIALAPYPHFLDVLSLVMRFWAPKAVAKAYKRHLAYANFFLLVQEGQI